MICEIIFESNREQLLIQVNYPHKQLEMHEYILSTVATDDLVLKYQVIFICSIDQIWMVLHQIHTKILLLKGTISETKATLSKIKINQLFNS